MKKYAYYVLLFRQSFMPYDCVQLLDYKEAVEAKWITEDGRRIWAGLQDKVEDEKASTFMWGFDSLETADAFYDQILNQVSRTVYGNAEIPAEIRAMTHRTACKK